MADISRTYVAQMHNGAAFNRYEARAHQASLNLANNVATKDIIEMVLGFYLLREEQGRRFQSAYFTPSWTRISRQAGQAFHTKLDTDFTASWTAISRQAGQ
ncbi:hypothetical protein [Caballeronia arationis]|nr:hypothetical protein [Caballeronia arationis]